MVIAVEAQVRVWDDNVFIKKTLARGLEMRRRCHVSLEEEMSAFCCDFKEDRLTVFFFFFNLKWRRVVDTWGIRRENWIYKWKNVAGLSKDFACVIFLKILLANSNIYILMAGRSWWAEFTLFYGIKSIIQGAGDLRLIL